jgi:hypothetical protein
MPWPMFRPLPILLLSFFVVFGPSATSQTRPFPAQQNSINIVDSGLLIVQNYTSLKLDPLQRPVVSYSNYDYSDIKVAHCGDPLCATVAKKAVLDRFGVVTGYPTLALNAMGTPIAGYFRGDSGEGTVGTLRLSECVNPACSGRTITVVDAENGQLIGEGPSMVLDASGNPVISYLRKSKYVTVAHCGDSKCLSGNTYNVLDDSLALALTSLALDNEGNPVVAYINELSSDELLVAHCSDPDCQSPPSIVAVDTLDAGRLGGPTGITVDSQDHPVLAYTYSTSLQAKTAELRVLHCGDSNCDSGNVISAVDESAGNFAEASMVLDASGNPVISYRGIVNSDDALEVAHCGDANCSSGNTITVADSDGHTGFYSSLQLDILGRPVVSYVKRAHEDIVKLLHCATDTCQ